MAAPTSDAIFVPVLPSLRGFTEELDKGTTTAAKAAGQNAGKAFADGLSSAKAAVDKASSSLAMARNKEADALDKISVAQAKLATLTEKGVTDAGRLAAAKANVAKAERDHAAAADRTQTATANLAAAEERATTATKTLSTEASSASKGVKDLGESTEGAESKLSTFGKIAAAGAGLAVLGKFAKDAVSSFLDIGEQFANVNKTLQFTTGATGAALDGMTESVKNIGKASPKSLGEIASVLAKVSQRTNLTGGDLELLTKQVMKVNAVMGEDTDVNGLTAAFAAYGVSGKQASASMDELFKASRATGVSVNELAAAAVKGAPQFQQFGLSLGESASLMGSLDKAGINSDAVLTGLNKAMINFAKAGREPKEALNETIASIQNFTKSGNDAAALELAGKLFGTKGAGQFVNAVKSGAVSVEGLTAAVDANQKGVMEAGGAIPTLSSAWAMFKNNVIIALEPIATRVFGIFIEGLTWFRTTGVQAIQAVTGAFSGLLDGGMLNGLGDLFANVKDGAQGLFDLLIRGDFTGKFADVFNVDEDAPIVGQLLDMRDKAIEAFNEIKGGFIAFKNAFIDGGDEVTSSGFAGFLEQLGIYARDIADAFNATVVPAVKFFAGILIEVGSFALPIVFDAAVLVKDIIVGLGEAVFAVVNFFKENKEAAIALGGILAATLGPAMATVAASFVTAQLAALKFNIQFGLMLAREMAVKAFTAVTKGWAAAQALLNAAWAANPIGIVIAALIALGAGLVLAYKHSETFRNIVQAAWEGIQKAISFAWNSVIKPIWEAIKVGIQAVGAVFSWLYNNIVKPIFTGMKIAFAIVLTAALLWWQGFKFYISMVANVITWLWNTIAKPVWDLMKIGLQMLGDFFGWVWNSLIKPAWDGLAAGISWVWENVIRPSWDALKIALQAVGDFFWWVWNTIIKPAWDGLAAGILWTWQNVIRPAWDGLKAALGAVGDFFNWVWNSVIKPAWDGLGAGIRWVVDNVISPAWGVLQSGLDTVKSSFQTAVEFIGKVWDGIKAIVAKPVRFVVETVYNNGIREAWNKVAGWLGLDELPEAKLGDLGNYATGGVLPGYTPGRDVHQFVSPTGGRLNLSGGEAVMRPEWTAAVGPDGVADMNRVAKTRGAAGVRQYMTEQNLALGGTIDSSLWNAAHTAFPNATLNSAHRPGDSGYHGKAGAVDLGGPMQQIANWIYDTYPDSAQLIWGPGPLLYNVGGNKIADQNQLRNQVYAGDLPGHYDHVHWASDGPIASDGKMVSGDGASEGGGIWGWIKGVASRAWNSLVSKTFDAVIDPIGNAIPTFGDSSVGQLPKTAFNYIKDKVRGFLLGKADEKDGASGSGAGVSNMAPGSGPVVDQVREVMKAYGWDSGPQWDALDQLISHESGWNPLARNPSSGAFGLGQFLGGTKDAYLPDENPNPGIQAQAMARYISDRYGDPISAWAFWQNPQPNPYGGNWYDDGGIANGKGVMAKNVIKPERVLDPRETAAFEKWMDAGAHALDFGAVVDQMAAVAEAWANGVHVIIDDDSRLATPGEIAEQISGNALAEIGNEFAGIFGFSNPFEGPKIVGDDALVVRTDNVDSPDEVRIADDQVDRIAGATDPAISPASPDNAAALNAPPEPTDATAPNSTEGGGIVIEHLEIKVIGAGDPQAVANRVLSSLEERMAGLVRSR